MMDTNLYRVSKACWAVTSEHSKETQAFTTIEAASDYLLSIDVNDDHIDLALADMSANGTTRANFGNHGTFIFSDNEKLSDKVGIA
jgi:hypothetical protein